MAMTPEDVQATQFKESWRGYAEHEVDDFMARVAHALQTLATERDEARAKVAELSSNTATLEENERLLRRTLLTAERTAEETVERAEADAERIRVEARAEAERLRIEAHDRAQRELREAAAAVERVREVVAEFRGFRDGYREQIRGLIARQVSALDEIGDLPELPAPMARRGEPPPAASGGADAGEAGEDPGDLEDLEDPGDPENFEDRDPRGPSAEPDAMWQPAAGAGAPPSVLDEDGTTGGPDAS